MSKPKEPLQQAIEIIGKLKGQMLQRAGFSDWEILTYIGNDPEIKELKKHLYQTTNKPMEKTNWNSTTEGKNQKPSHQKSVEILTKEQTDFPQCGVYIEFWGWYSIHNSGTTLIREIEVTFWREYELPK